MRVAFVASECEPWAKTGGLGDVVDALARAVGEAPGGPDGPVDVFLPSYRGGRLPPGARTSPPLEVRDPYAAGGFTEVRLITAEARGYRVHLVDCPAAYDRDGYYGDERGDYDDNPWRFGLLCRAALTALREDAAAGGAAVDVLHLHDWQSGGVAILRDGELADDPVVGRAAIVVTLHNLAFHGWTPRDRLDQLGLTPGDGIVPIYADGIDVLRAAIERAEIANTVSPTYAAESLTPEFGFGLQDALAALGDRYLGILNGIDEAAWNPGDDPALPAHYDRHDLSGKAACRRALLGELGFDPDDPSPILGHLGRIDQQKGVDLIAEAAPALAELGARVVVLGTGDPRLSGQLAAAAGAAGSRLVFVDAFDRDLARRIYAGCDLFLMPSRFEPSGLTQMIAMRYGTPPVARRTGGLADSIVDEVASPGAGTGFLFDDASAAALLEATRAAMALFEDGWAAGWGALVDRGMATRFGWQVGAAPSYLDVYRRAIDLRRSSTG
jgi:starch synthase